ncbi:MAG: hypothetical protein ACREMY_03455, partial [bacterium]
LRLTGACHRAMLPGTRRSPAVLIGVVDAGGATGHDVGTWFGTVDARILFSMEAGFIASKTGSTTTQGSAVMAWELAWSAIRLGATSNDQVNVDIAHAEDASIAVGRGDAAGLGRAADKGEESALLASNSFRVFKPTTRSLSFSVLFVNNVPLCGSLNSGLQTFFGVGMTPQTFDERDYGVAFTGAFVAFSTSYITQFPNIGPLEPYLPPL